ncbi:MAG: glycosyltransferase family 9 protein [Candidatus Omnitrophica bacterium]|nr:glycosyltransferase family 9 protein [Candidatus Omnitrophota bacterium]
MADSGTIKIGIKKILQSEGTVALKAIKLLDYLLGSVLARILSQKKDKPFPTQFHRILVIRPGGIGDAVFLLPVLKHLRKTFPSIIIDVLCEQRNSAVFSLEPNIVNNIFSWQSLKSFRTIFTNSYDVVIDTEQWHYASALVTYFMKNAYSIGFATRPLRKKLFNAAVEYGLNDYELNNFTKLFSSFLPEASVLHNIHNAIEIDLDQFASLRSQIPQNAVTIFLGGSIRLRRFNKPEADKIVGEILRLDEKVVLIGGKKDINIANFLELKYKNQGLINLVGKTTLKESAAIIKLSKKFIGHDSGMLHIAIALQTPVIAIWGPGNQSKWLRLSYKDHLIYKRLPCSPCTQFGYTIPICHNKYLCTEDAHEHTENYFKNII